MSYEGGHSAASIKIHKCRHDGFALGSGLGKSHGLLQLCVRNINCGFMIPFVSDIGI